MPKLEFDPKFSLGNIITVVVLGISLVGGWFTLVGASDSNAEDILVVSQRVTTLETSLAALIREINGERVDQTRILTQLQTDMSYTRAAVDDLRRSAAARP